ncbi:MAG: oxidoreductase [Desulfosarcinaceae bacterium]|jgi:predicted dehydrogenase
MIKTAVIGYGLSASVFHLPLITSDERYELVAVSTRRQEEVAAQRPGIEVFATGEALIEKAAADLVVVTAPNAAHYPLAKAALAAGRHVVLEKPLVPTLAEGERLRTLAQESGRLLVPFHNRRWDGDFLTVQHLIREGRLGALRWFEAHCDRFRPQVQDRWRERPGPGSGLWFDWGPHLIDQALCLFGTPRAVTARCLALREGSQATDNFHVLLHYPAHEVILHGNSFAAGPNLRFQVQGTQGSFVKYGLDPQEDRLKAGIRPDRRDWAAETPDAYGTLYTAAGSEVVPTETGGYQNFYSRLAMAVAEGAPVPVKLADALTGIALIELAEESSRQERTLSFNYQP